MATTNVAMAPGFAGQGASHFLAGKLITDSATAPIGAKVNSQGREPLEKFERMCKPRRGDTSSYCVAPLGLADHCSTVQALAPLAMKCQPFGLLFRWCPQ